MNIFRDNKGNVNVNAMKKPIVQAKCAVKVVFFISVKIVLSHSMDRTVFWNSQSL
jgi:hypothetical protein